MIRYHKLGVDEVYSLERRSRIIRETMVPACRPVGARIQRLGEAAVATSLDRPRFLWSRTARTLRVMDSADLVPGAAAASTVVITGTGVYTFPILFPGFLRRIVCRDELWLDANNNAGSPLDVGVRVDYMTLAGALVTRVLDGAASGMVPFDSNALDLEIETGGTHMMAVSCRQGGAQVPYILNVRFEFALNITAPGA